MNMNGKKEYAHKAEDGRLQTLSEHAKGTAERAREYASAFGMGEVGYAMGLFHDVGKYATAFQKRLSGDACKVEHSTAGMALFYQRIPKGENPYLNLLIAYAIGGHHTGLPDCGSAGDTADGSTFFAKINRRTAEGMGDFSQYREELGEPPSLPLLPAEYLPHGGDFYSWQFLGRMLFSALVDADFLDTEAFMSGGKILRGVGDTFLSLEENFRQYMKKFAGKPGKLNEDRAKILSACEAAAPLEKGLFRLTVPTGGGKTLSSMAFALRHLHLHGMRRVIYVIPYVSIIRQTAHIFEEIFGKENVLGHYASADFKGEKEETGPAAAELAAENWDKPIIVTTNVRFFEALHASGPAACRRLHNIANSVLIFDETQMLPVGLLRPCLRAVSELVKNYGCTAVLCTATQPALEGLLAENAIAARDICPDTATMYADFARVGYVNLGKCADDTVWQRLREAGTALCVLNSRAAVRKYYAALKGEGVYHLSTYMTPMHLGRSLTEIRERLHAGKKCLVLSTSLIEAGVDLDFPAVYREMFGLDSIIQAGGRCNREGKRPREESNVYVFSREETSEKDSALIAMTERIWERYGDISSPSAIHAYFERLYEVQSAERKDKLDEKNILPLINQEEEEHRWIWYREIEKRFRYIQKDTSLLVIPNAENSAVCAALRAGRLTRGLLRELTKDSVSVYEGEYKALKARGVISTPCDGISILEDPSFYAPDCGLILKESGEATFL